MTVIALQPHSGPRLIRIVPKQELSSGENVRLDDAGAGILDAAV
jgi:hypothetical protein